MVLQAEDLKRIMGDRLIQCIECGIQTYYYNSKHLCPKCRGSFLKVNRTPIRLKTKEEKEKSSSRFDIVNGRLVEDICTIENFTATAICFSDDNQE